MTMVNEDLYFQPVNPDGSIVANDPSLIKVVGVGGGGGNAVANMYREHIQGVRFLVCNTDAKHLQDSPVPNRLQIGPGLGAGGRPETGRQLAEQHLDEIGKAFDDGTKMVFITAGMGGGTGTGAGPIIAQEAMKRGILTIGIVTIPFIFEGNRVIDKALDGVQRMEQSVDALLIVNNERLRDIYPDLTIRSAFQKADETLTKAVHSIVEVITMHDLQNLDFCDVETCLRDGGVAIMSSGYGRGENRMKKALEAAITSPLLNDQEVERSRSLRVAVFSPPSSTGNAVLMEEYNAITEFMANFRKDVDTKWGYADDPQLTDEVKITIIASGFRTTDNDNDESNNPQLSAEDHEALFRSETRRSKFYDGAFKIKHRHHRVHRLDNEDLDNEELIKFLDNTPTVKRTENDVKTLQKLSFKTTIFEMVDL